MKARKPLLLATLSLAILGGAAIVVIASLSSSTAAHGTAVQDYVSLVDALRASGSSVEPGGAIEQPFFAANGTGLKVNGQEVQAFEYPTETAADRDANTVSDDGGTVGTTKPLWTAAPHFYQKGKVIALYIGDDAQTLELLSTTLGPQFAGK